MTTIASDLDETCARADDGNENKDTFGVQPTEGTDPSGTQASTTQEVDSSSTKTPRQVMGRTAFRLGITTEDLLKFFDSWNDPEQPAQGSEQHKKLVAAYEQAMAEHTEACEKVRKQLNAAGLRDQGLSEELVSQELNLSEEDRKIRDTQWRETAVQTFEATHPGLAAERFEWSRIGRVLAFELGSKNSGPLTSKDTVAASADSSEKATEDKPQITNPYTVTKAYYVLADNVQCGQLTAPLPSVAWSFLSRTGQAPRNISEKIHMLPKVPLATVTVESDWKEAKKEWERLCNQSREGYRHMLAATLKNAEMYHTGDLKNMGKSHEERASGRKQQETANITLSNKESMAGFNATLKDLGLGEYIVSEKTYAPVVAIWKDRAQLTARLQYPLLNAELTAFTRGDQSVPEWACRLRTKEEPGDEVFVVTGLRYQPKPTTSFNEWKTPVESAYSPSYVRSPPSTTADE